MSQVIPGGRDDMLQFYADHLVQWEANAASIGLTLPQVTALRDAVETATSQVTVARQTRDNAKAATDLANAKAAVARSLGGGAMSMIRAYAENNGPQTYDKAGIPAPKPPVPAGPPTPAVNFTADPRADGTILLKWRGTVAQNASFDILRSIDGGPYTDIKNTRDKSYLDSAVPSGVAMISYRVYGKRDNVRSTPASTNVLFGTLSPTLQAAFGTGGQASEAA